MQCHTECKADCSTQPVQHMKMIIVQTLVVHVWLFIVETAAGLNVMFVRWRWLSQLRTAVNCVFWVISSSGFHSNLTWIRDVFMACWIWFTHEKKCVDLVAGYIRKWYTCPKKIQDTHLHWRDSTNLPSPAESNSSRRDKHTTTASCQTHNDKTHPAELWWTCEIVEIHVKPCVCRHPHPKQSTCHRHHRQSHDDHAACRSSVHRNADPRMIQTLLTCVHMDRLQLGWKVKDCSS